MTSFKMLHLELKLNGLNGMAQVLQYHMNQVQTNKKRVEHNHRDIDSESSQENFNKTRSQTYLALSVFAKVYDDSNSILPLKWMRFSNAFMSSLVSILRCKTNSKLKCFFSFTSFFFFHHLPSYNFTAWSFLEGKMTNNHISILT